VENGGKVVSPSEKRKGGNGGQAGGRVAVSDKVGWWENLLTFWMKWIKLMQRMKNF
jgi:hypothetical protein